MDRYKGEYKSSKIQNPNNDESVSVIKVDKVICVDKEKLARNILLIARLLS